MAEPAQGFTNVRKFYVVALRKSFQPDALETGSVAGREWPELDPLRKLIVVTAHRRESFGDGFERIREALARLALRLDVQIAYPVHRNPNVMEPVTGDSSYRSGAAARTS